MTKRSVGAAAVAAIPIAFLAVLVIWPLAAVFQRSLTGVGLGDIAEILARRSTRQVVWFSTWQAALSTVVTLLIGLPIAQALARYRFTGRRLLRSFTVVPFVLPTVVVAAAITALFARLGLSRDHEVVAIVAAHVFFNVAIVVRIVGGAWDSIDQRLIDAARSLGASPGAVLREVVWPRIRSPLAAAATLIFLFSFTSFGVVRLLGGVRRATIETEIFRQAVSRGEFDVAAVLAILQILVVVGLAAVSARFQRSASSVARGRARPHATPVVSRRQRAHLAMILVLVLLVLGTPVVALIEQSLRVGEGYGLANYRRLVETQSLLPVSAMTALFTSIRFALVAALVAAVVGGATAVVVVRSGRLGRLLESLALVPLGISAVTLGFGYLVAFTAFDLRRSVWLVPVSHAVIGVPFVVAAVVPALRSIDPALRDAAAILGATPGRVRKHVDWPLTRGALGTGAGFAAAISIGEFGATSFVARGDDAFTAPLAVFRLLSQPSLVLRGQALALSVIIGVMVAVLAFVLEQRRTNAGVLL